MGEGASIQGELQAQIMAALWRIKSGTVEQVRAALPPRYQGAYNTVQTVLNRLATRGLLTRERRGQAMVYRPKLTEADYLSHRIESTLAGASFEARQAVLARLVGGLDQDELERLRRLSAEGSERRMHRP